MITRVNIKAIENIFHQSDFTSSDKSSLSLLLQTSQTAENFLSNLQSEKELYLALIKGGFIYIPGFSSFNDDDLKEMQNLINNNDLKKYKLI